MSEENSRTKVAVFVFIRRTNTILLVKQRQGSQNWSLPGGTMEPGESLDETAVREVKEETGLDIQLTRVVGLYSKPDENALAITFEAQVISGKLAPANEISAVAYFSLDNLPKTMRAHMQRRMDDYLAGRAEAVFASQ